MATHDLKCWPAPFQAIWDGRKKFELRRDDRDYRVDDWLVIREWCPTIEQYTHRKITTRINYKLEASPEWGLAEGFCILSLGRLQLKAKPLAER